MCAKPLREVDLDLEEGADMVMVEARASPIWM